MRSLVVVRCCLIVCLVSQIGPRIRISDNGRHDTNKIIESLEMGAVSTGTRNIIGEHCAPFSIKRHDRYVILYIYTVYIYICILNGARCSSELNRELYKL